MNSDFRKAGDLDSSNTYFKPAGNLDDKDSKKIDTAGYFRKIDDLDPSMKYFKQAGDLEPSMKYFKQAGDLDSSKTYFKQAGDLPSDSIKKQIEDYILTVVSGRRYEAVCELGTLCGGGRTVVSFDELKEMVNIGYNIISAKYINDKMIDVEFQQFRKNKTEGRGR